MDVCRYRFDSSLPSGQASSLLSNGGAVFAEVVVDIPARELGDKLFTYRVPDYLKPETFVGAQVLVPFGHQEMVGGYVVALKERSNGNFEPKDLLDVLDNDPLFDRDYIEFLYWVADYYCASLSSVIAAAVPADFGPRLKRAVELVKANPGEASSEALAAAREDGCAQQVMEALLLSKEKALSLRTLKQRSHLSQAQFYRAVALLRQAKVIRIRAETQPLAPKMVTVISLSGQEGKTARQEEVISILRRSGGQMPLARLVEAAGTTRDTIRRMVTQGLLSQREEETLRDPLDRVIGRETAPPPELTGDQSVALERLSGELDELLQHGRKDSEQAAPVLPFLLHGVTGSGKTEIYLRLIARTLEHGRSALLLVPEISLTPQLAYRLKSRFRQDVAVWHSALSAGERYDTWRRLRSGSVRVLLGARSAVLASMPDVGLVILDEEHDGSYKQSSPSPRYHAKQLALEKARRAGALVLIGSATPDLGSFLEAGESNRLLALPERVFKQAMPAVAVVDMRREFAAGNRSIFSNQLSSALAECLGRGEQAILLMNRRGFANHVFCRACGFVMKCNHCSVSLVFHQSANRAHPPVQFKMSDDEGYLACHHCGFTCPAESGCPNCRSPFLKQYGLGTQRVEHELKQAYPSARLLRLDADVARRKGAYEEVLGAFQRGEADILVGTQMVAKGLDIANVTLVGVLAADAAFNVPDYRSTERGFQLLTQVAGRAGRGDRPGTVVLQTYNTDLPALRLAKKHDYESFARDELAVRKELGYPPFCQIVRVVVAGAQAAEVEAACEQIAEELTNYLEEQIPPDEIRILGPAPCLIERLRGSFRFHLLVKNFAGEAGRSLVTTFLRSKRLHSGLKMAVDVDAFDLL
jgi:primosomal protein N' (replication factor Y)